MESNGGNKCARKLDLTEILKTNISMEMFVPVKIIEEAILLQNCCGQPAVLPNVHAGSWFEATFSRRRVPINLQQQICS